MVPRFAVSLEGGREHSAAALADGARHAEALGFDMVTLSDHPAGRRPSAEPATALAFVLGVTERIAVVPWFTGPYRHPALLAKIAAQLAVLGPDRVVLGLSGGTEVDTGALGIESWTADETLERERETVDIVRGLLAGPSFTYRGRYYRVDGATLTPRPDAPTPIWISAAGPRSMRLIGQLADGWMPSAPSYPLDAARVLRDRITTAAARAGRPPTALAHAYRVEIAIDEGAEAPPPIVAGPPEHVAEAIREILAAGFDHPIFHLTGDVHAQRERLAREVLPLVGKRLHRPYAPTPRHG